jgi:putative holliday junction resolvase
VRYLAVDLGDKRTGLAVGDDVTGLVSPAGMIEKPIEPGEELLAGIEAAIEEFGPDELVLGLPLNMDDTEGPRAKLVRRFAARVAERAGLEIRFQDERLTSAEADWSMARSGMTRGQKKNRRDALAAAAILRDYLESLA